MDERVANLIQDQAGVVSRRQLEAAGLRAHDVERFVRRRELSRLHRGVLIDHTGEPSWIQHAWAGVLLYEPAVLQGPSAVRAVEGPGSNRPSTPIHIGVDRDRRVARRSGLVVVRMERFEERVQWNASPPRQRYEDAVIDVAAAAATNMQALGELARAVQGRRTTARRLLEHLERRPWVERRSWMMAVLGDVAAGACSVLEHAYLVAERRHGVSGARRQVVDRLGAGVVYRDVEYKCGLCVELDGRLFHDTAWQRDRDFDRDLDLRVDGRDSVRLSWGQVIDRPCWTMARIVALLHARGWAGTARPCAPGCAVGLGPGGFVVPGTTNTPGQTAEGVA
ncbi:type IV toxin-antitoxin system AbiEi family antitoxin domain-containing protein [Microbacterium sp.]|uniref:type IV toxin-antitoxin system AbiEi family antitoxin domain-containing protein n=1 Tax=Microbacterium sp. TaxID=51671 RepID=UPI003735E0CA